MHSLPWKILRNRSCNITISLWACQSAATKPLPNALNFLDGSHGLPSSGNTYQALKWVTLKLLTRLNEGDISFIFLIDEARITVQHELPLEKSLKRISSNLYYIFLYTHCMDEDFKSYDWALVILFLSYSTEKSVFWLILTFDICLLSVFTKTCMIMFCYMWKKVFYFFPHITEHYFFAKTNHHLLQVLKWNIYFSSLTQSSNCYSNCPLTINNRN